MSEAQDTDLLLVNRNGTSYKQEIETMRDRIDDTDLLLVYRGNQAYKITGRDFIDSTQEYAPPVISSANLEEEVPGGARYANQDFDVTFNMTDDGEPTSNKEMRPYVFGGITTHGQTSPITNVGAVKRYNIIPSGKWEDWSGDSYSSSDTQAWDLFNGFNTGGMGLPVSPWKISNYNGLTAVETVEVLISPQSTAPSIEVNESGVDISGVLTETLTSPARERYLFTLPVATAINGNTNGIEVDYEATGNVIYEVKINRQILLNPYREDQGIIDSITVSSGYTTNKVSTFSGAKSDIFDGNTQNGYSLSYGWYTTNHGPWIQLNFSSDIQCTTFKILQTWFKQDNSASGNAWPVANVQAGYSWQDSNSNTGSSMNGPWIDAPTGTRSEWMDWTTFKNGGLASGHMKSNALAATSQFGGSQINYGSGGALKFAGIEVDGKLIVAPGTYDNSDLPPELTLTNDQDLGYFQVGDVVQSFWNQSEVWSSGMSGTPFSGSYTNLFDGDNTSNLWARNNDLTFTPSASLSGVISVVCFNGNNSGTTAITLTDGQSITTTSGTQASQTITFNSASNITSITFAPSGVGSSLVEILLDGKNLVDAGVTGTPGDSVTAIDPAVPSMSVSGGTWAVGDVVTNTVERQLVNIPKTDTITTSSTVSVSTGYEAVTYTGNGATQTISGMNITPSLVWLKNRGNAVGHNLYDVIRGVNKPLITNSTAAEDSTNIYGAVSAFTSDGFTIATGSTDATRANANSTNYIAWCFDAGDWASATVPSDWDNSEAWSENVIEARYPGQGHEAFNGNLTTYFQVETDTDGGGVNFSPALSGDLEVFVSTGAPNDGQHTRTITLSNGTTQTTSVGYNNGPATLDFGAVSNISSVRIDNSGLMYGFKLDGNILVDKGTIPVDSLGNSLPSMQSRVKANPTAGFSIATYIAPDNTNNQSFAHGLGVKPDLVIIKNLGVTSSWDIYHSSLGYNASLTFTTDGTRSTSFSAEPTSTLVYTTYDFTNYPDNEYVVYSWAEKPGISKISSYVGNGQANGPTVTCGFEPAFLMIKGINAGRDWQIVDSARNPSNPITDRLFPNASDQESSQSSVNFTSTGFQVITTDPYRNNSGETYIFMAVGASGDSTELGFASGEDLNRFSAGDNAYYGNQPSAVTGTVQNVVDSGNTHTMQISPANAGWATNGFVTGDASADPDAKLYCIMDSTGNVTDLDTADPGYTTMTAQNLTQEIHFPSTFPSGVATDTELPVGTSLQVDVKASNAVGTDSATTNVVTPTV